MGGIEGYRYTPSKVAQARANSDARYYSKNIKPQLDKQVKPGRLLFQALGVTAAIAKKSPQNIFDYAEKGGQLYDLIDKSSENAEAFRMRNNAPGDLSGMAYKGPTKIYRN